MNRPAQPELPVPILGVEVTSGRPEAIVDCLDRQIAEKRPTRVAFLNANLAQIAASDLATRRSLSDFLVLNDGIGVSLAKRVLHGDRFEHNLNGTDFMPRFLDRTSHTLRIFLLGSEPATVATAANVISRRWTRHQVVGFVDGFRPKHRRDEVVATIQKAKPDVVLVAMGNPKQEAWIAENVPAACPCAIGVGAWFDFVSGKFRRAPAWIRRVRMEWIYRLVMEPRRLWRRYLVGNAQFLAQVYQDRRQTARRAKRRSSYHESRTKRAIDVVGSAVLLVLLSPTLALIALAVKASSPGPALFRQARAGQFGNPFVILKFRTMYLHDVHDTCERFGSVRQATQGDPRVTSVGRLLRRTSLDELPQLINVFRGEMSLVGPRPHALSHDRAFAQQFPSYTKRFAVKPGMTGLAQVNGARGETRTARAVARRIGFDLHYIRSASIALDIAILARTASAVFGGQSAY